MNTVTGSRVSAAGFAEASICSTRQRSDILEGEGLRFRRVELGRLTAAAGATSEIQSLKFVVRAGVGNTFANFFRMTTHGESRGGVVGFIIDGMPPRLPLREVDVQFELDRRRSGQSRITTPRKVTDTCKILSGVADGLTLGTPIGVAFPNTDQRGRDYSEMSLAYRPSHADATYDFKCGVRAVQGGGLSSARKTIGQVAAGAVAKKLLQEHTGTLGGISNGETIVMRIALKPTSTIASTKKTVTRDKQETELRARGRHDPCVVPRGQTRLRAVVDKTRTTSIEEDQYALDLQEDEELLKEKAALVGQQLAGTCIFLVGMMGSGKTTVGRSVSDALGYFFFDSDKLVEEAAGGTTVAEMFRAGREEDFRNAETDVLEQLCNMSRLVVATGGGAVVRPQNWGHMRHGITVWLDVPVECLAQRVVAVGCHSRPLLGVHAEDSAYQHALERLTRIFHERQHMYKNADVVVSVGEIARRKGLDIETITPTMIAVQVLEEIARKLESDGRLSRR